MWAHDSIFTRKETGERVVRADYLPGFYGIRANARDPYDQVGFDELEEGILVIDPATPCRAGAITINPQPVLVVPGGTATFDVQLASPADLMRIRLEDGSDALTEVVSAQDDQMWADSDLGSIRFQAHAATVPGNSYELDAVVSFYLKVDPFACRIPVEVQVVWSTTGNAPPTVNITSPADRSSATETDMVTFQGTATDPEDGPLSGLALAWSSDVDGPLGIGEAIDRDDLSLGRHVISLTAADSEGLARSTSVTLDVLPNTPPVPTIDAPPDVSMFDAGESVAFQGTATDAQDGMLSGSSLVWTSDRDGLLGTGATFSRNDLSTGSHRVTLTATDRHRASASVFIDIEVAPNASPTVAITAPRDGERFDFGTPVALAGSAFDAEDGTLSGTALAWSSDRDGPLGTGESLTRADLSLGTHVVTLAATDRFGGTSTASVTIEIEAPNQPPTVSITEPAISIYLAGFAVPFAGSATDPEDGPLTGASLVWTSSWEGVIGTGTSFSYAGLRVGSHLITLTATDSEGATASATRSVTIQGSGNGTIRGRVEVTGLGVPGVTVSVTGPVNRSTTTDNNGRYTLSTLPAGTYTVSISNIPMGFVFSPTSRIVTIAAGQTVTINFTGSGG